MDELVKYLAVIIPIATAGLGLWVFCIVDIAKKGKTKTLNPLTWILIILLGSLIGSILYILIGREAIEVNTNKKTNRKKILFIVQFAILLALEAIFCFTPLGSIPMGPLMVATLGMIPVIITSLLLGTAAGSAMGLFAGIFSLIVWIFMPPVSFLIIVFSPAVSGSFWSVIFCIVPRVLVGTVTGLFFNLLTKINIKSKAVNILAFGISAALGSFINTAFVLWGGYIIFFDKLSALFDGNADIMNWIEWALGIIGGTFAPETAVLTAINIVVLTNGIPELIISAIVGVGVCMPLKRILTKQNLI
jgi:uncharacterized membrane protein